jgi:hypothetical protein
MFCWPLLKCGYTVGADGFITPNKPVLLLVPGDLHQKTIETGRDIFRTVVAPLDHQDTFESLLRGSATMAPLRGSAAMDHRSIPPGFYITSYTQLGVNGVAKPPDVDVDGVAAVRDYLSITSAEVEGYFAQRGEHYAESYRQLHSTPADLLIDIQRRRLAYAEGDNSGCIHEAFRNICDFHTTHPVTRLAQLPADNKERILDRYVRVRLAECLAGVGESKPGQPKCIHSPTLADLAAGHFHALIIDEGVRIKGEHTKIGVAARQLRAPCTLILSATPIKNRLPDIYRLAWLAAGGHAEATARFPFNDSESDRDEFAETFCVSERNLTKEKETDRRWVKLTPQVCNVHQVWKLFGPIILRRRKKDIGQELVKKTKRIIRVPMGREQAAVYQYHMQAEYLDHNGRKALGAQLQALRAAAAAPTSDHLQSQPGSQSGPARSHCSYTPKVAAILQLAQEVMARREQLIIFSSLHDPLDLLETRLQQAGVRCVKLDGRMSQARRGKASAKFRVGPPPAEFNADRREDYIPVMLASSECMAEGHDWPRANNVVQADYPWAMDKVLQSVDRAYRLNSERDLNYWTMITEGTIERRMESMCDEKSDASELVLDGHLLGETPNEMNLAELLKTAAAEFNSETKTIDETVLLQEWPALRESLRAAQVAWDYGQAALPIADTTDTASTAATKLEPIVPNIIPLLPVSNPAPEPVRLNPTPPPHIIALPSAQRAPVSPLPSPWRQRILRRTQPTLQLV